MKKIHLLFKFSCLALLVFGLRPSLMAQKDTIPPTIVITDPDTNCIQIGSIWVMRAPIITDNQSDSNSITVKFTWGQSNGAVNSSVRATYILTIEATDSNGNKATRVVNYKVDDCMPPIINLNTSDTVCVVVRTPYNSVPPTATDNFYPPSQVSLTKIAGIVDTNIKGLYAEVFEAIDGSGNKTTKTRYVLVADYCGPIAALNLLHWTPVNIYPNPALDYISIDLTNLNTSEPLTVKLIAMDGKEIFASVLVQHLQINVTDFSNGVYSIVVTGGNKIFNKVIVIQH